jgi:hypothetical protein
MDEATFGTEKKNVVFNNWQMSDCKRYRTFVGTNKWEDTHVSIFYMKNRYDVLSNLADCSLIGDELSL